MSARALAVGVAVVMLAGCGADVARQEATEAALAFVTGERSQACDKLAPGTRDALERRVKLPCESAIANVSLPTGADVELAEVAGEGAQVRFADQVLFLARFADGWRVTAAGCQRADADPAEPYECEVES